MAWATGSAGATASIFGSSRYNITGPTAALVPLIAAVVIRHGVEALPLLGIMAAVILIAFVFFFWESHVKPAAQTWSGQAAGAIKSSEGKQTSPSQ